MLASEKDPKFDMNSRDSPKLGHYPPKHDMEHTTGRACEIKALATSCVSGNASGCASPIRICKSSTGTLKRTQKSPCGLIASSADTVFSTSSPPYRQCLKKWLIVAYLDLSLRRIASALPSPLTTLQTLGIATSIHRIQQYRPMPDIVDISQHLTRPLHIQATTVGFMLMP